MIALSVPRQFDPCRPEMIDRPDADPALLESELHDIRNVNRRLGGLRSLRRAIIPLIQRIPPPEVPRILDLATGSADQPVSLARTLRRLYRPAIITAVDRNARVLDAARRHSNDFPEIRFEQWDILDPPYPDGSFHIALCSLALHHFSGEDAVRIIRHMDRLSRTGFILSDLARSAVSSFGAWAYTRLATRNPMTRYDAVASVRASFTKKELSRLLEEADAGPVRLHAEAFLRLVAVKDKAR